MFVKIEKEFFKKIKIYKIINSLKPTPSNQTGLNKSNHPLKLTGTFMKSKNSIWLTEIVTITIGEGRPSGTPG